MIKRIKNDPKLLMMIFTIAIPVAFQNLLSTLTQMLDTIMLGELGDIQLTASSLANQVFFVFMLLIFGACGGGAILTSQYWGKKELEPVKIVMATLVRLIFVISCLLVVVIYLFPENIMRIFTPDELVIAEGVNYLKIVAPTYIFFGLSNTFSMLFRSVEKVKIAVIANASTLVINASLNYTLIFGNFGAPKLGLEGAAYATLIARFVEMIVVLSYVFFFDKQLNFTFKCLFRRSKTLSADLRKYCAPVVVNELAWSIGITMQAALFGHLSTNAVSANTIIGVVQNISTLVIFGVANASAVIIGKTIGEGDIELAKQRGRTLEYFALVLGVVAATLIFFSRDLMVDFYNVEETTKVLAKEMLVVTSFVVFFVSTGGISIVGLLRGGGDAKYSLMIEFVSLWLFSVPLGYIGGLYFEFPIVVVYALFKSDELVKCVLCWIRLAGTKWIRSVTRDDA